MDDKLFIIAIGGTGMRCLESFVHLCAVGMFDNKTIEVLTLDTDQSNGNKGQVEALIELYNKIKTTDPNNPGGEARSNTFFSARLNLYHFTTNYSTPERRTFRSLADRGNQTEEQRADNRDLADLFFDHDTVQDFALDHGYRAQTHLGSMLMYHGILEAAIKVKRGGADVGPRDKELQAFLQLLNTNAANARVFVFGSVFGGTGASSIPVIPIALRDALKVLTDGNNELNLDTVHFGSTLLTDYFSFNSPDKEQRNKDKVIADSNNFTLNSQAALSFYVNDLTVKNSYRVLYHIGWSASLKFNVSDMDADSVVTGGNKQKNACHLVELMCAAAAYDFFTRESFPQHEAQFVFRTVEQEDGSDKLVLSGSSFVGEQRGAYFEQKLGNFLSLSHLMLSHYKGAEPGIDGTIEFLRELLRRNIEDYKAFPDDEARQIDQYLREFAYRYVNGKLEPGWLHQIFQSVKGSSFIFNGSALSVNLEELKKVDPGAIYSDDRYNWEAGFGIGSTAIRRVDKFIGKIGSKDAAPIKEQGETLKERFIGNIFRAICLSQKQTQTK